MLVHDKEAKQMYCPFKFLRAGWAESGKTNQEWTCEGLKCMAWQKIEMRVGGKGGFCGLARNPSEIGRT